MIDWDPDYYAYMEQEYQDLVGDEEYTGRPIRDSNTRVGITHHPNCPYGELNPDFDCCTEYWEADYQKQKDLEAEEMHQEWWQ